MAFPSCCSICASIRGRHVGGNGQRRTWKLTTDGPIRRQQRIRRRGVRRAQGNARLERAGLRRCELAAGPRRDRLPAAALAAQMIEPIRVTETLKPIAADRRPKPGRVDFRHGPEHGRLVPPQGVRPARHGSSSAPRRDAQARRHALPGQHPRGEGHGHLHAQGQGHGDLRAALHLSRLSLRGGDRLSRQADVRVASKGRWCTTTWTRPASSPAPIRC